MLVTVMETIKDLLKYIIIIGIIILIRIFVLTTTEVIGNSMNPNYIDGDIMMVEQLSQRFNKIDRFDIIVLKYTSPSFLIKRVIGLPGDKIKYVNNELYVNGKKIQENFDKLGVVTDFETTVSKGAYFVMGDNRGDSKDSREFGEIKKTDIIGKPFLTIWPLKKIKLVK